jgi:hypothetical protein
VSWFGRLLRRDRIVLDMDALDERVASARRQRVEAAKIRADAEKYGQRNRRHVEDNNFGERFKAAFEARRERRA